MLSAGLLMAFVLENVFGTLINHPCFNWPVMDFNNASNYNTMPGTLGDFCAHQVDMIFIADAPNSFEAGGMRGKKQACHWGEPFQMECHGIGFNILWSLKFSGLMEPGEVGYHDHEETDEARDLWKVPLWDRELTAMYMKHYDYTNL